MVVGGSRAFPSERVSCVECSALEDVAGVSDIRARRRARGKGGLRTSSSRLPVRGASFPRRFSRTNN